MEDALLQTNLIIKKPGWEEKGTISTWGSDDSCMETNIYRKHCKKLYVCISEQMSPYADTIQWETLQGPRAPRQDQEAEVSMEW